MRGMARGYAAGDSRDLGGASLRGRWVSCRLPPLQVMYTQGRTGDSGCCMLVRSLVKRGPHTTC